jgi:hypothetical protein
MTTIEQKEKEGEFGDMFLNSSHLKKRVSGRFVMGLG